MIKISIYFEPNKVHIQREGGVLEPATHEDADDIYDRMCEILMNQDDVEAKAFLKTENPE